MINSWYFFDRMYVLKLYSQCCQVYGFFFKFEKTLTNLGFVKNLKKFNRNLKIFKILPK